MAQDSVKQGGGLTKGKPAVERVWLHPHRLAREEDARRSDAEP